MNNVIRRRGRFDLRQVFAILGIALLLVVATSSAQSLPQLTPEQQRALNALSPEEKQAMLRRFGLAPASPAAAEKSENTAVVAPGNRGNGDSNGSQQESDPVLAGGDTVIVVLNVDSSPGRGRDIEALRDRINNGNPYRIDTRGQLFLPELPVIVLGGLSEAQATLRLAAEPALAEFNIEFHRLPVQDPEGPELAPFGYEAFRSGALGYQTDASTPVPSDYTVGPGDTVQIQYYGSTSGSYVLAVDRDGTLALPQLGPLKVAGLSFDALRQEIQLRVSKQLIGSEVSVTLGQLRSVRVFLVGDVESPGAYQVNAFSTISNVLALGGGVAESGSLRGIQQKRNGRVINTFDAYSLLLSGDASRDRRVANGDVIFVPPVGAQIEVAGEVRRPAIYELRSDTTVAAAIEMAGGTRPVALRSAVKVERGSAEDGLSVFRVDVDGRTGAAFPVTSGDRVVVYGRTDRLDQVVRVQGHVYRPGVEPWRPGMHLSEVLNGPELLKPQADMHYVLIRRQRVLNGPIEVLSADLPAAWSAPLSAADPVLLARDQITVFSMTEDRQVYLAPILETLRLQAVASSPTPIVSVDGEVKRPGDYPLESGMTVADLIRAGGGLTDAAYRDKIELRRFENDGDGQREASLLQVSVGQDTGLRAQDLTLEPYDHLNVKAVSNWRERNFIDVGGEVLFPGRYSARQGETLSSVLERAGGLTPAAFADGALLFREALKEREREQLEELAARVESDLATLALSGSGQPDALGIGQSLLRQIRATEPTGRLVIDMGAILAGDANADVLVRDGDRIMVPKRSQEITVVGEVQYATSHLWQEGLNRNDYIERSGGITSKADRKRIYVVRASGEVVVASRSRFYSRRNSDLMRPGDTIVVPLQTDRVSPLVVWSSATQIIYNLAIAAAAVNSF